MNHFELFGLPSQFQLDGGLLSSQFRELQKQFHPDKFAAASERDKLMSVQKTAQINEAYQTLKDPISRAEYMLLLEGIELKGEQQTLQDPEFLMEQMAFREELEDIPNSSDPETKLFDFDEKVTKLYKQSVINLESLLSTQDWESAANSVRKLKFIAKLRVEVERIEDKLLG